MQQKHLLAVAFGASLSFAACAPPSGSGDPPATGGVSGTGGGGQAATGGSGPSGSGSGGAGPAATGGAPAPGMGGQPAGTGGKPVTGAGGAVGTGGVAGTGGAGPTSDAGTAEAGADAGSLAKFSFFYTSLAGMRRLSGSQNGFGGDLRFGTDNGLTGADKICQTLAADVGFGAKTWRAFLSAFKGPDGMPVNAIDRIGEGPWYDRRGRLISMDKAGLLGRNRPAGESAAVNDMVDENGMGRPATGPNDTHDVITGTNNRGTLRATRPQDTCMDWTSASVRGTIGMGHAWPAGSGMNWMQVHTEPTCVAGVNLVQNGPGNGSSIGAGGGWGGIYCFALTP